MEIPDVLEVESIDDDLTLTSSQINEGANVEDPIEIQSLLLMESDVCPLANDSRSTTNTTNKLRTESFGTQCGFKT